jgi:hypothetical protein
MKHLTLHRITSSLHCSCCPALVVYANICKSEEVTIEKNFKIKMFEIVILTFQLNLLMQYVHINAIAFLSIQFLQLRSFCATYVYIVSF